MLSGPEAEIVIVYGRSSVKEIGLARADYVATRLPCKNKAVGFVSSDSSRVEFAAGIPRWRRLEALLEDGLWQVSRRGASSPSVFDFLACSTALFSFFSFCFAVHCDQIFLH